MRTISTDLSRFTSSGFSTLHGAEEAHLSVGGCSREGSRAVQDSMKVLDVEPMLWGKVFEPVRATYDYFRSLRAGLTCTTARWMMAT